MISKSLLSFTSAPMVHLEVEVHTRVLFFKKKKHSSSGVLGKQSTFQVIPVRKRFSIEILEAEFLGFIHALEYLNTL